jgi:hypothetical protein
LWWYKQDRRFVYRELAASNKANRQELTGSTGSLCKLLALLNHVNHNHIDNDYNNDKHLHNYKDSSMRG